MQLWKWVWAPWCLTQILSRNGAYNGAYITSWCSNMKGSQLQSFTSKCHASQFSPICSLEKRLKAVLDITLQELTMKVHIKRHLSRKSKASLKKRSLISLCMPWSDFGHCYMGSKQCESKMLWWVGDKYAHLMLKIHSRWDLKIVQDEHCAVALKSLCNLGHGTNVMSRYLIN